MIISGFYKQFSRIVPHFDHSIPGHCNQCLLVLHQNEIKYWFLVHLVKRVTETTGVHRNFLDAHHIDRPQHHGLVVILELEHLLWLFCKHLVVVEVQGNAPDFFRVLRN